MKPREVCAYTGLSIETVYRLARSGKITFYRPDGTGSTFVRKDEVDAFIAGGVGMRPRRGRPRKHTGDDHAA
jgi:excisionase family DNA binding protein